jgi:hypothetical protein
MIGKLADMFRADEFVSSSAVFPSIDKDRIEKELDLKKVGKDRGSKNLPDPAATSLDHIELKAIARVEELRRRGLENFETNRRVYSERLNRAVSARMLVETEANDAKARFAQDVTRWKALMVTPRERVQETYRWRSRFRQINSLEYRPAKQATSWPNLIGLSLLIVLLESVGNAYLFSQNNPLGFLGGVMAALLVSLGNVCMSTLLGVGSRYINLSGFSRLFWKLIGLSYVILWIAFAAVYNSAVAHFRDAVETTLDWREAGELAIQTLLSNPAGLHTLESYILVLLGFFISIVAFLKGYHSADPYPGYSRVAQDVVDARNDYIAHLEASIGDLASHKDAAVEALHEARDEVELHIKESVDALYGQKALHSNLTPFLGQCNIAANYLIAVYRDANKAERTEKPPAYFNDTFAFDEFVSPLADESRRKEAEEQAKEVAELVKRSVQEIFDVFHNSVSEHYEIDELEGTFIERARDKNFGVEKSNPEDMQSPALPAQGAKA